LDCSKIGLPAAAGVGSLSWVWMGELIPSEYKVFAGIATSIGKDTVIAIKNRNKSLL